MRFSCASVLHFDGFRYDPDQRALFKRAKRVPLRSKASDVLHLLLTNPGQIVTKRTLREQVWGNEHVADQCLFQAICDVRQALAPLNAVVTHPNQGYRFTRSTTQPAPVRRALAACVLPVVAAVFLALGAGLKPNSLAASIQPSSAVSLSPSMQAFASGVAHLRAGEATQAEHLFALALQENPAFVEARLMLGETYLAQGRLDEARAEAGDILSANDALGLPDAHTAVAAMALISRTEDSAGSMSRALHWAFEAAERAHRGGLACTASDIEDRIENLLSNDRADQAGDGQSLPSSAASRLVSAPPVANRAPDYCAKFPSAGPGPEARNAPDHCETSPPSHYVAARWRPIKTTA